MNKAEKAEMERLRNELAILGAMWIGEPVLPDIAIPEQGTTSGWAVVGRRAFEYGRVDPAWSEPTRHGTGQAFPASGYSGSRGGIPLFSTKGKAFRALRYEIARMCAERLADIDKQIAEAGE